LRANALLAATVSITPAENDFGAARASPECRTAVP